MLLVRSYRLVCSGRGLKQGNVYEFKNLGMFVLLLIGWESGASFVSQSQSHIFCEINGEFACRLMYIGKLRKKHMPAIQMVLILFWSVEKMVQDFSAKRSGRKPEQTIAYSKQGSFLTMLALLLGRVILILQSGWTRWASNKITLYWNNTTNRSKSKYFCFLIWFLLLLLLLSAVLTSSR